MEQFGIQLKKLRESKNMSQAELAKELYVSRSAVAKWEQGRGFPNIDSLRQIAQLFEVTIDELVSDKEIQILEIKSTEKVIDKKKLFIVLSALMCVLICVSVTFTAMYCPRRLSNYISINPREIVAVYVEKAKSNYDPNAGYYDNYERKELKRNDYEEFLNKLYDFKVYPKYRDCLCDSPYWFYITTANDRYCVSGLEIYNNDGAVIRFKENIDKEIAQLLNEYALII